MVIFMHSILVIEDDQLILDTMKIILTRSGHNVETASNGYEGVQKFDDGFFDLVITDMCMPEMNGNDVAEHIRNSGNQFIPVVGISGTPWFINNNNFDSTLNKPFKLKTLIDTVNDLLASSDNLIANYRLAHN